MVTTSCSTRNHSHLEHLPNCQGLPAKVSRHGVKFLIAQTRRLQRSTFEWPNFKHNLIRLILQRIPAQKQCVIRGWGEFWWHGYPSDHNMSADIRAPSYKLWLSSRRGYSWDDSLGSGRSTGRQHVFSRHPGLGSSLIMPISFLVFPCISSSMVLLQVPIGLPLFLLPGDAHLNAATRLLHDLKRPCQHWNQDFKQCRCAADLNSPNAPAWPEALESQTRQV